MKKPGLLSKIAAMFGRKDYVSGSYLLLSQFTAHKFTDFTSYYDALGKISSLSKSLDTITKYCQLADWGLYQNDKLVDSPPADLLKMLKNPNPWETFESLMAYLIYDLCLSGNLFLAKYGANAAGKKPRELQRLYPQYVRIVKNSVTKIERYEYGQGFGPGKPFQPEEIIHAKYMPNPKDEYWGLGVIEANIGLFDHAIDLNEIRARFMDNGAVLSGLLRVKDKINETERKEMQAAWESKYSGRENAGKTAVLGSGAEYQRLGMTPDEMKALDDLILTHREIFMLFGVPPFLRNLSADDNPKYDNIFQQEITFRQLIIAPILKIIDAAITNFVQQWYPELEFKHEDVTDRVSPENIERMQRLGDITPDEARVLFGLKPTNKPAMKKHYAQINLIPIDDLSGLSDPSLTAPGGKPDTVRKEDQAAAEDDATTDSQTAEEIAKEEQRSIPRGRGREKTWRDLASGGWASVPAHGIWTLKELSDRANVARIQRDFLRLERASLRRRMASGVSAYQNFLNEQLARILDAFNAEKGLLLKQEKASGGLLARIFNDSVENAMIVNVGAAFYKSLTDSAYGNVGDILSVELALEENRALAGRVDLLRRTAPRINDTTKAKLKEILDAGISEGLTQGNLAQRIQEGLSMYNSARPVMIARNELAQAYRQGNRQAMLDSNIITHISVIGCMDQETGAPTYNGQCTCNITDVPIGDADKLEYHVNHTGAEVPSRFGLTV